MTERCEWCDEEEIQVTTSSVYWELPDGSRAIEIKDTPTIKCSNCDAEYQQESIVKGIENQLYLVDRKKINSPINYKDLMEMERLLKKNYFDFSS
ncbi:YokU family protein [Peribacillus alkalitolerans]|uniref:YokU family protein n=1 Tax=Peribacillus alkalitolerans TaxID=1550385 RepID=UPI0013D166C4|nr:YokU family protein [Peribacillus alkalitolerans]